MRKEAQQTAGFVSSCFLVIMHCLLSETAQFLCQSKEFSWLRGNRQMLEPEQGWGRTAQLALSVFLETGQESLSKKGTTHRVFTDGQSGIWLPKDRHLAPI